MNEIYEKGLIDYTYLYGKPLPPNSLATANRILKELRKHLVLATVLPVVVLDESTTVTHNENVARVDSSLGTLFIEGGRGCEIRRELAPIFAKEFGYDG